MSYFVTDETLSEAAATTPTRDPEAITAPEKSLAEVSVSALIFLLSVLYFRLFYSYTLLNGDEGIVLQGAERILQGQVLYRDFFSFLTPGSYYWLALFFKLFGSSMLVARAVLVVEGALLSVLTYLLARRVCSRWSALLAAYFVTVACVPFRFLVLHNWESTLWAYVSLYCAVWFLQKPHWVWAFAIGFFTALTCLFEQSKGAGLVLGLTAGLLVVLRKERGSKLWSRQSIAALAAGLSGPFVVALVYFGLEHSLVQLFADCLWPLHEYSAINKAPFGFLVIDPLKRDSIYSGDWISCLLTMLVTGPWYLVPLLAFAAVSALIYWSAKAWPRDNPLEKQTYYVLSSATMVGLLLATLATGRPDFTHLLYLAPLFFLALAWIMDGRDIPSSLLHAVKPLLALALFLSFSTFGLSLLWAPLNAHSPLPTRRGTLKTDGSDHVLAYVQDHVPPGQKMLVYPYLPLYYYLTDTYSPSRYEYLMPAMHTPQQFQEMADELAADRTRVVLFEPSFREKIIAGFPSATPEMLAARDPVEDYIVTHYRPCASLTSQDFWRFLFMVRKDLPCPAK
jgi:4-amino-4-deoxy-L-arabinose transferase-like glycosyltransferase